jgi:hypothetical protein
VDHDDKLKQTLKDDGRRNNHDHGHNNCWSLATIFTDKHVSDMGTLLYREEEQLLL